MASELVEKIQSVAAESLRIVASIESLDYEIEYIRDDIEGNLSSTQFERIAENIIAEGLAGRDIGALSGVGIQEAHVVLYEEVELFTFPTGKYGGVIVSLDRTDGTSIDEIVQTTTAALSDFE